MLNFTDHVYALVKSYLISYVVLIIGVGTTSYLNFPFNYILLAYAAYQLLFFVCNAWQVKNKMPMIKLFPSRA